MLALELVKDETAGDRTPDPGAVGRLFEETKKRGLLIGKGGLYNNAIRFSPPLTIQRAQVEEALRIMGEAFEAVYAA